VIQSALSAMTAPARLYVATVILLSLEAAYSAWWVISDLVIRFVPAIRGRFDADMVRFVQTVPIWQEAIYFTAVAMVFLTLVLVMRRSGLALFSYVPAILLFSTDWILAGMQGEEFLTLPGYISLVFECTVLGLLVILKTRSQLR
jgi:hypothetical protein